MNDLSYEQTLSLWDMRPSKPHDEDRLASETALYLIENDYSDVWLNTIRWNITEFIGLIDIGRLLDTVSESLWVDIVSIHIEHWRLKYEDLVVSLHWIVRHGKNASSLSRYKVLHYQLSNEPINWASIVSRCQCVAMMREIQKYTQPELADHQAWILYWFSKQAYKPLSKLEKTENDAWNSWIGNLSIWKSGPLPLLYTSVRRVRKVPFMSYSQHDKLKIVRDYYPLLLAKAAWFKDASVLLHDDDWDLDDLHTYHVIFQYKFPSDYKHWMMLRKKPYINRATSNMHLKWLLPLEFNMSWVDAINYFESTDHASLPLP